MRLAVYCGSMLGNRPAFAAAARDFGSELVRRGIGLVYGGASVGLMGVLADAVLADNGEVIGVIPVTMVERELAHSALTTLHVVDGMHERKAMMHSLANGFVALPGGVGTLDELFEMWTWAQLGIHHKPIGLLNVDSYFDRLLAFTDDMMTAGFVRRDHRAMIQTAASPATLLDAFEAYRPPEPKWADL